MDAAPIMTKAQLRRAVIRTAARAHWKHDRTGARLIAAGCQDNDSWASERERFSTIAFARQQASALPGYFAPLSCSGPGTTPCSVPPERTLPCEAHSPQRSAPAGTAAGASNGRAAFRSRASGHKTDVAAVPAFSVQPFHSESITHG